jgi:hypothetical protein
VGLGATYTYRPPRETLVATSSRSNSSKALAVRVVLAHPCAAFHPCMCGLRGFVAVVAAVLIGYDGRGGYCRDEHEEEMIMNDYFLYTDTRLR